MARYLKTGITEAARADAESWWQCIELMQKDGSTEIAANELKQFRERFPDYLPAN